VRDRPARGPSEVMVRCRPVGPIQYTSRPTSSRRPSTARTPLPCWSPGTSCLRCDRRARADAPAGDRGAPLHPGSGPLPRARCSCSRRNRRRGRWTSVKRLRPGAPLRRRGGGRGSGGAAAEWRARSSSARTPGVRRRLAPRCANLAVLGGEPGAGRRPARSCAAPSGGDRGLRQIHARSSASPAKGLATIPRRPVEVDRRGRKA